MKKIGKEVLFLSTSGTNPRNGEGSFLRLKDGRIMFAYTQYYGVSCEDHATARIAVCYSCDEGENWTAPEVLIEKGEDDLNIMSVSLLSMENGDIGLLYLRKYMKDGNLLCMPYFCRFEDEGKTFCPPIPVLDEDGYYVINNDRMVRLKSGRIIIPLAYHGQSGTMLIPGKIFSCFSDDDGVSWYRSENTVSSFYQDGTQLQEPGIFELDDGRVWMWCRTAYGCQHQCFSSDGGKNWSQIMPNYRFTSPDSPMQVKKVGKYTVAIFNPIGFNCLRTDTEVWKSPKRTPFVCAISEDGGVSFVDMTKTFGNGGFDDFVDNCYLLEDDTTNSYCYPAIIEVNDGFLTAYFHSNNTEFCLNSTKITKVTYSELEFGEA